MITGILPVDKDAGWTSHDVVGKVRRVVGQRQVGHAGTLDPLATGLLILVLGQATRLAPYLMGGTKEYCAEVVLGATTATDDAEGEVVTHVDASHIGREHIDGAITRFTGTVSQVPPLYAAVRHNGERLYVLARRGEEVAPEPRVVTIEDITVECWEAPRLRLRVRCGAGTYIRALARDIGVTLGVGGYLHALRRVASGSFTVLDAASTSELTDREAMLRSLMPPDRAVVSWPAVVLDADEATGILHGRSVTQDGVHGSIRVYGPSGAFLALAEAADGSIKPFRVFGSDASDH